MNERIQELAEQSGMTQYVAANNKYLERFARAIVQECVSVVQQRWITPDEDVIAAAIKEHFGVKK